MPRLVVCPRCEQHIRQTEARCPHCASSVGVIGATAAALLLGLASGCTSTEPPPKKPPAKAQPLKVDKKAASIPAEPEYAVAEVDEIPPAPAYGVAEPLPDPPPKKKEKGKSKKSN